MAIVNCSVCGERDDTNKYLDDTRMRLIFRGVCFECDFWWNLILLKDDPNSIRIEGHHFFISEEKLPNDQLHWAGFSGREFEIKFNDGRMIETNNLWSQGTIPDRFKKQLNDNAYFVK